MVSLSETYAILEAMDFDPETVRVAQTLLDRMWDLMPVNGDDPTERIWSKTPRLDTEFRELSNHLLEMVDELTNGANWDDVLSDLVGRCGYEVVDDAGVVRLMAKVGE